VLVAVADAAQCASLVCRTEMLAPSEKEVSPLGVVDRQDQLVLLRCASSTESGGTRSKRHSASSRSGASFDVGECRRMNRVDATEALDWVRAASKDGDEWVGFNASGWPASAWILHAMYETDDLPGSLTHDDEYKLERAAGAIAPPEVGGVDLESLLKNDMTVVGAPLGASSSPGPGWHRLLWAELGARLDVDPLREWRWPGIRSFPFRSWPSNIRPPGEGSLDREQLVRLCEHLAETGDAGNECYAFGARLPSGRVDDRHDELLVYRGTLSEVLVLYDDEQSGGPSNLWAADRSWFAYTDWDLWGTKVSGSDELIGGLFADGELEAVELPAEDE
jgi:hypothetical protein